MALPPAAKARLAHRILLTAPLCVDAQILFRAKDLDPEPRSHVVRGNGTQSALLAGLGKFVLYELRVLAFTRIGNGVPSSPPILERTRDDGAWGSPSLAGVTPTICMLSLLTSFSQRFSPLFQQQETKQSCWRPSSASVRLPA